MARKQWVPNMSVIRRFHCTLESSPHILEIVPPKVHANQDYIFVKIVITVLVCNVDNSSITLTY